MLFAKHIGLNIVRLNSNFVDSGTVIKNDYISVSLKTYVEEESINEIKLLISPNPTSQTTEIRYHITDNCNIKLSLVNLLGQEIAVIDEGFKIAGSYNSEFRIQNSELPNGMYFVRLLAGGKVETEKMIILK